MKKFLILTLLVSTMSCSDKKDRNLNLDQVNVSSFSFFKVESSNSIPLAATEGNITFAFGPPAVIKEGILEISQSACTKWIYKGATIYLQGGRMVDIDLKTPDFGFVFNGTVVKVGEDISKLKVLFPGSYSQRSSRQILISLSYNGDPIDTQILFDFNLQNRITAISLMG
ncbi:MAG TPA: hypothetical protein VLZ28_06560 [Daejeonella sp.]|nr:hypothetical protein [Daejeonella sp.]